MNRFRTSTGINLAVREYGNPAADLTIFLAHCWTLNREDWHYQVRDLLAEFGHDIRIVTWDHRGHGESDPAPRRDCTIANLAADMGELIDATAPTGKLLLAGHSIGGMTMMALAEQRPDILDRVVGAAFVATSSGNMDTVTLGLPGAQAPIIRAQIPRMLALRSRTLSRRARRRAPIVERQVMRRFVFGKPMRLADSALTVDGLISCPAATLVGFYEDCMRHERADALKAYDGIPTRVLVGTRDLLTPPAHARRIRDQISTAELLVAPDAGHMLPLERDALVSGTLIKLARPHVG
ncbi:MAG TPA: alpha/beta hydrolase [Marmoricola sp.]